MRICSLLPSRVQKDKSAPEEKRKQLAVDYTTQAVRLLRKAAQVAGPNFQRMLLSAIRADEALDPIRKRREFRQLFTP